MPEFSDDNWAGTVQLLVVFSEGKRLPEKFCELRKQTETAPAWDIPMIAAGRENRRCALAIYCLFLSKCSPPRLGENRFQDLCTVPLRTELAISYNHDSLPISGRCTHCGENMPTPDGDLELPGDIVLWLSVRFLEHKKLKHPNSSKSNDEDIALRRLLGGRA